MAEETTQDNATINPILENIYQQPEELHRVLNDLTTERLETVKEVARLANLAGEIVLTSMGSALYSLMPMYEALLDAACAMSRW